MSSRNPDAVSGAASSPGGHYGNEPTSELDEPDRALMEKFGMIFGDLRPVKTTTHIHPTLSHSNLINQSKGMKKTSTTSPASTLSDKGIGSSVGSVDLELRHEPQLLHPSRLPPYDANKTGSLDSRKHDLALIEKPMSAHIRSSSDIIGSNGVLSQPSLAEQSGAAMWNSDPRRNSFRDSLVPASSVTLLIRSRKASMKRQKPPSEVSVKDAEIKKLPQLFRLSPSSSSPSSVASSTYSLTQGGSFNNIEMSKSKVASADSTSSDVTLQSNDDTLTCDVTINISTPPTPDEVAPPLPPKAFRLHNSLARSAPSPIYKETSGLDQLGNPGAEQGCTPEMASLSIENAALAYGRPRGSSDGALRRRSNDGGSFHNAPQNSLSVSDVHPHEFERTGANNKLGSHDQKVKGHDALWERRHDDSISGFSDPLQGTFNRGSTKRSSTRSNPGERRGGSSSYRPHVVDLQPFNFVLHHAVKSEAVFAGREWLFAEILETFKKVDSTNKGVIITGKAGQGKTAIINHLASQSYQSWSGSRSRQEHDMFHRACSTMIASSSPLVSRRLHPLGGASTHASRTSSPIPSLASSRSGSQMSLIEDSCRKLASQVVAFHFCQSDNNATCYVPEFIHNIASQMSRAPQLAAYKELLLSDVQLQSLLSFRKCIVNPSLTLRKAIIDPIVKLRKSQKLPKSNLIILIDSLTDAEIHRPDHGYSVLSFLEQHLDEFPEFIKIIVTCDSGNTPPLPLHEISLDNPCPNMNRDVQAYVSQRIATSEVLSTFTLAGQPDPVVAQKQLTQYLVKVAQGNFLFLRLCLDLIDQRAIVLKSAGFKVIPVDMHEVCLLLCNLNYSSYTSFYEVRDIIAVAVASLYPLKDEQIYHAVCCGLTPQEQLTWAAFKQNMALLTGILVLDTTTGRRSFFHPCFRKWFMGLDGNIKTNGQSSHRFQVDIKRGHALLATVLSRQPPERLHKHATLELAHHLIQAQMFTDTYAESGVDQNGYMLAQSSATITDAFISLRNLFFPNLKVAELLLRAGADPNASTSVYANAPSLAVAAETGCFDLVSLLLSWGADINLTSTDDTSPLIFAASEGHFDVVRLLLRYQPGLSQIDHHGLTALLHAIKNGHSSVAKLLLSRDLYRTPDHHMVATQQALVAAATKEDIELTDYLLEESDFDCDVNFREPSNGESPLTSAAAHGRANVCEIFIRKYCASVHFRNREGLTPLFCAVKHDQWEAVDMLINWDASLDDRDDEGKSPLILAACYGHVSLLQLLISRGAAVDVVDNEGITSLGWAALQGHVHCVRTLIGCSDIHHCDVHGRRAIDLAVMMGNTQIVDLLLEYGTDLRHNDVTGMSALDHAIQIDDGVLVTKLLRYGAEVQAVSWKLASRKPEVKAILLKYFLEAANSRYRGNDFVSASEVYADALKRVGELHSHNPSMHDERTSDICARLLLGYSRSMRKLGNVEEAEVTASRALELKPDWFEALYARSRVRRENSRLEDALRDVIAAESAAPPHNLKDIRCLRERIETEMMKSQSRSLPHSMTSSKSDVKQNDHDSNALSRHHDSALRSEPTGHRDVTGNAYQLHPTEPFGVNRLTRGNSQESIAESMVSLSMYPVENPLIVPGVRYHSNNALPQRQPHHYSQFHHSVSKEEQNGTMPNRTVAETNRSSASDRDSHVVASRDNSKPFFVTDL